MIISIFSPKGGVGKTTLTLALANVISKEKRTCVVEYDFSPGDFPALLSVSETKNILNALNDLDGSIQRPEGRNYDVIVGAYPDDYEKIGSNDVIRLVTELEKRYDVVLFDIQPGFIESCIDVMGKSEKVILVVEDELRVAARVNSFLDWLKINELSDLSNYFYIKNKSVSNQLQYIDKIRYKLPILYSVPFIKKLKGIDDKHLIKYMTKAKEAIL
ncbi:AAA family ATPase [Thermoanaerobacterium sp. RBIITD]|uniref:AAA family ATPase n=1 Tax=Thermoanaerobacterium sp. RBIITD TaxID=1550240 RepID=UPI000BB8C08D|nr:AAA family ATPase [Thermoanaerobacterium sp. RBIITD]SNX54104.1 AAA domain-containing protein [Thermoanaerobacterium sp. RBIITD]